MDQFRGLHSLELDLAVSLRVSLDDQLNGKPRLKGPPRVHLGLPQSRPCGSRTILGDRPAQPECLDKRPCAAIEALDGSDGELDLQVLRCARSHDLAAFR